MLHLEIKVNLINLIQIIDWSHSIVNISKDGSFINKIDTVTKCAQMTIKFLGSIFARYLRI